MRTSLHRWARLWAACAATCALLVGAGGVSAATDLPEAPVGPEQSIASEQPSPSELKPVRELPALRSENSDTFEQADGSRLLKISPHAINYRVDGIWQPINDELTTGPHGDSHPTASPVPVSFPVSLGSAPVSVGEPGKQLSFRLIGASASGSAAGAKQSYPSAFPGVAVSYSTSPESVRETLTLTRASVPTAYRYALSLSPGMQASLNPSGGVTIADGDGGLLYSLATPTVTDSSTAAHLPWTSPVHYELNNAAHILTVVLNKRWLADPSRVFPVTVDPDVYFGGQQDCSIASHAYASTSLCGERLYVGANTETPKSVVRSLLQFDLSAVPRDSVILSSSLAMWFEADTTSSPIEIDAFGLTRDFTQAATWNTYDGTHGWTSSGGDMLETRGGSTVIKTEYKGGWVSWGFSPLVEQWVREPASNHGILLKAHNETATGYDTFIQTANGESAPEPDMNIVYEPHLGNSPASATTEQEIGNGGVVSVNATNGDLNVRNPDVRYGKFGYNGYNTELGRSYNTYDDELVGSAFGEGWRLDMGEDELLYPAWWDGSNVFHQPDGSYTRFDRNPENDGHPAAEDLAFTAEEDEPATLVVHDNGTRTLTYDDTGQEWLFDASGNGFPQEIIDHEGEENTLSLSYTSSRLTGVTDTHGHSLTLARNPTTKHVTKIEASGEEWLYGYNLSHQLTSYEGPEGQKAEYTYNGKGLLASIKDPSGTLVITYYENYHVAALRKIVNGTLTTAGSEDEVTSFTYQTPESPACESSDSGETIVGRTPEEGESEIYCYDAAGNVTGYIGREADEGGTDAAGEPSSGDELEYIPPAGPEIFGTLQPNALAVTHYCLYTPDETECPYADEYVSFHGSARKFNPGRLAWSIELGEALTTIARSDVTELATAYTLPRKRKINYSDDHVESPDHLFHSSLNAALGQEYQLAVNFEFQCEKYEGEIGLCIFYFRHEYKLTK